MPTERDREATPPPPAPDVTADPRRSSSSSPPSTPVQLSLSSGQGTCKNTATPSTMGRNNEVRTVMVFGVPIVALVMDTQERLCLAQISNTLLKDFSYNEIHNRRVALGITCVQCTPVQLELLRRAGAMPVSSRRCGMITKREAERLCKSFLADITPPKLPDSFAFDVYHQCAWGCRGSFMPSRYNSSRAKCIKCTYCGLFFSPNKFIFHSHRLPDSKYVQPDAANFNSWRRHIKLSGSPPEEVIYAWEDVKAMFNGGSRKRAMAASLRSDSRGSEHTKHPRLPSSTPESNPISTAEDINKPPFFPLVPVPNKSYPLHNSSPYSTSGSTALALTSKSALSPPDFRQSFAEFMWAGKQPFSLSYGGLLWPRGSGLAAATSDDRSCLPNGPLVYGMGSDATTPDDGQIRPLSSASEGTTRSWQQDAEDGGSRESPVVRTSARSTSYTSAFRPVGRATTSNRPLHIEATTADTTTVTSADLEDREDANRCSSDRPDSRDSAASMSDHDEVDVIGVGNEGDCETKVSSRASDVDCGSEEGCDANFLQSSNVADGSSLYNLKRWSENKESDKGRDSADEGSEMSPGSTSESGSDKRKTQMTKSKSPVSEPEPKNDLTSALDLRNISILSKDDLRRVLLQEEEARKRAEREYQLMRETLEEQVRKEIAYREEIAKQLQIVRDALCQELDHERKARFAVQQKLKEAHDALHHFSCKMMTPRHCTECGCKLVLPQ